MADTGFVDPDFPPDPSSVGQRICDEDPEPIQWVRASQLVGPATCKLFDEVHPNDCLQGELGNCWLIAAFASLAEFPSAIEQLFEPKEIAPDGKYTISLYDVQTSSWTKQIIDDLIPCREDWFDEELAPIFSKPKDSELWVLLLEKAFAKFVGSYENLGGGGEPWAWQALTGMREQRLYYRQIDDTNELVWHEILFDHDKQRKMVRDASSKWEKEKPPEFFPDRILPTGLRNFMRSE